MPSEAATPPAFHAWATTPPMGWNSWDCFGTTVTEAQVRAHADYMAAHLARFGYRYVVVDIQWYEPEPDGFRYRAEAPFALDGWGRLLPAPNRFPSSVGGRGFRPLAESVHAQGLAFGLHLLRGIAWIADEPSSGDRYLALFNTRDPGSSDSSTAAFSVDLSALGFAHGARIRDLWARRDLQGVHRHFAPALAWHGAGLYRLAAP